MTDAATPGHGAQSWAELSVAEFLGIATAPSQPAEPVRVTAKVLREAIANQLAGISANELAEECEKFGLEPSQGEHDDPWKGKFRYVERRLRRWPLQDLVVLAGKIDAVYDSAVLRDMIGRAGIRGVAGEAKNLIFASSGPKPDIVFDDAINNDIRVVRNEQFCLVFDRPIGDGGLTWRELVSWRAGNDELDEEGLRQHGLVLYGRLLESMASNRAEQLIFRTYAQLYRSHGFDLPALIPQVYLHYDPLSRRRDGARPAPLVRQRMDFLLLLPMRRRIVIELDGKQHYADEQGAADPRRYAEMVAADRALQLAGYEVYRIGGHELVDAPRAESMLRRFFLDLLGLPEEAPLNSPA